MEGQWCVTGERGRYRFVGLAPTRRYAVGVRRASMWGDEDQEAGWKRARERASSRPAEEWPTPGVWFGSQEIHPGPTLFQREVREPQEGDELRMDILLSVSDEGVEARG